MSQNRSETYKKISPLFSRKIIESPMHFKKNTQRPCEGKKWKALRPGQGNKVEKNVQRGTSTGRRGRPLPCTNSSKRHTIMTKRGGQAAQGCGQKGWQDLPGSVSNLTRGEKTSRKLKRTGELKESRTKPREMSPKERKRGKWEKSLEKSSTPVGK